MTTPIVALSLSEQVEKFGAYAGFAAVLGLAVLALLYFASAREVKRLREWADRAPERVADLEARLAEVTRQRAAAPKPVGKGAATTGSAPATAAALAAKKPAAAAAGNGAEGPAPAAPGKPAPATTADAPAATAAGETVDKPFDAAEEAADLTQIKRPAKQGPPASDQTLVGAAGRELRQNRPSARPRPQPAVRPSTARLMESARASNAQRRAGQPPARSGPAPRPDGEGAGRKRTALIAGGALVAVVVAVLLVTVVFGGGDDSGGGQAQPPATQPTVTTREEVPVDRAGTEVAVLNGTTFTGLASGVSNTLENAGWKTGEVTNAPDQTRSATIVEYTEGQKEEALEVARSIPGVETDAVVEISEGSRVLAPAAAVVVTVGSDQTPTATG